MYEKDLLKERWLKRHLSKKNPRRTVTPSVLNSLVFATPQGIGRPYITTVFHPLMRTKIRKINRAVPGT